MDKIVKILEEIELPFAYDHFAEGESPEPPFICYLTPKSEYFSAGRSGQTQDILQQVRDLDRQRKAVRDHLFIWNGG